MELVDDRGLPDARVAAYDHQRGLAARDDVECGKQRVDLALAPVQTLRYQQPIREVVRGKGELLDDAPQVPVREAMPEIAFDSSGSLISLLWRLGEQFHDDRRELRRDIRDLCARRHWPARDIAMHPL